MIRVRDALASAGISVQIPGSLPSRWGKEVCVLCIGQGIGSSRATTLSEEAAQVQVTTAFSAINVRRSVANAAPQASATRCQADRTMTWTMVSHQPHGIADLKSALSSRSAAIRGPRQAGCRTSPIARTGPHE
ncbi:MAG: hypothetical protein ACPGXK_04375 [Phycisphaerae bacterium]